MPNMKQFATPALWVLIIAGLQLGLKGVFGYDLISGLLGSVPATILNFVFGAAAVIVGWNKIKGNG